MACGQVDNLCFHFHTVAQCVYMVYTSLCCDILIESAIWEGYTCGVKMSTHVLCYSGHLLVMFNGLCLHCCSLKSFVVMEGTLHVDNMDENVGKTRNF